MRKRIPSIWNALMARASASHSWMSAAVESFFCACSSAINCASFSAASVRGSVVGAILADYLNRSLRVSASRPMPTVSFDSRLPYGASDEERSHPIDVERSLLSLAHRLHDGGEGVERLADQPDHEVVVVAIEAEARQANVVHVIRGAEPHADLAVLGEHGALLFGRQLHEAPAAAERIPDG